MVFEVEGWGRTAYGWDRSTWSDTLLGYFGEFSDVLCTALDGHMQYYTFSSSLSIPSLRHPPLLYGLIGEGAGRWVQAHPILLDLILCRISPIKFQICI